MKNPLYIIGIGFLIPVVSQAEVLYEDTFDGDSLAVNSNGVGGGAINHTIEDHSWADDGNATFVTSGTNSTRRAILYTQNIFQSDTGFKLTVNCTTGAIGDVGAHNLSFGLITSDTDPSTYTGVNPFKTDTSVYSIGVNMTANGGAEAQGLNFANGTTSTKLDQSGTHAQFKAGETCEVSIEIGEGGYWCYRIDGVYESSGVILPGFDLSKSYRVVVYGQDDDGGGKSIQSISLKTAYAPGERAAGLRGHWKGGEDDLESVKNFKTLDSMRMSFTDGATQSAQHSAPNKLMETIALEAGIDYVVAPSWGDLSLAEPKNDDFLERTLEIRAAGFGVGAYTNSENFVGPNAAELQEFVDHWMEYCDTNSEIQAFINSQPFHTGVWNRTTEQYEDASATYPLRKYMFCYAEFVLKDHALRYGKYFDSWIFDDGGTMEQNGDNATSGLIEEQRIYQAFANAVHAGNPEIPLAFNNGRSTSNYNSYPFAHAVRFDDFTFGHAFGGNNNHAEKLDGNQFNLNYQHVTRMMATSGYVHDGGAWLWDDLIVGNFHSKLSTTAWKYGGVQAWEEADFFQWNLQALQAGGHMTWGGSTPRTSSTLYGWAYTLLKGLDDHLAQFLSPGAPNWARAYTVLPQAFFGHAYHHVLKEEIDLWDPEGDEITSLIAVNGAPAWLNISEDSLNPGHWILSGTPTEDAASVPAFSLRATDANGLSRDREVKINFAVSKHPPMETNSINGGATWLDSGLELSYDNNGIYFNQRAISYSTQAFQSNGGFMLTAYYTANSIGDNTGHNFSFGLIRDDTDLTNYSGFNPFGAESGVYSLGVNLTENQGTTARGLNFTNGSSLTTLDQSGTHVEFATGVSTPVVIEIDQTGAWSYSINGIVEAAGVIAGGFDLSKSYRVVVYGQDDNGGEKSIQSLAVELKPVQVVGLLFDWSLNEGSNEIVSDTSGNGFHGSLFNGTGVPGVKDGAVEFNGVDTSVSLPVEVFPSINNEITIAMWVNGGAAQPLADTLFEAFDAEGNRVLNIHLPWSNSKVIWDAGNDGGSTFDRISKSAIPSEFKERWNHWVFTKSVTSGEMKVYLNGTLWNSSDVEESMIKSMSGIAGAYIGSSAGGSYYDGIIDEVKLYNVVLDASEVSELYENYKGFGPWTSQFKDLEDAGYASDSDQDGIALMLEYILNGSPLQSDPVILPTLDFTGGNFVFTFTRLADSADDTGQVFQYSSNLVDWTDLPITGMTAPEVSVGSEIDGTEEVTVTISKGLAVNGRLYGRLVAAPN